MAVREEGDVTDGVSRAARLPGEPHEGQPPPQPRGVAGGVRLVLQAVLMTAVGGICLAIIGTVLVVVGPELAARADTPALAAWRTVFTAIVVQGVPFLLLGTLVSAAIAAFVPASVFTKVLPRSPALAVPVAGMAGAVRPGCECASVPRVA
jgi:uncharacterized membrane protein YraQ (UPF0718 family)